MPDSIIVQPLTTIAEAVSLWLLTNVFGSILCWASIYVWSPFSWGDEEMLAPILIILLIGIESLIIIPLAGLFFEKVLAIHRIPQRLLTTMMLCIGIWAATCLGLLLFKDVIHWIALLSCGGSYFAALLLASGIVYRNWLFYTDSAISAPASGE